MAAGCNATQPPAGAVDSPGATTSDGGQVQESDGTKKIGFGLIWRNDQWWKDLEARAFELAAELNFELLAQDANLDAQKQVGQLEAFVAQSVDAIFFAPADANASTDIVAQAAAKGIPVITIEGTIDDNSNLATEVIFDLEQIGYDLGALAAEWMNDVHGGAGKYVVFNDPTNTAIYPQATGFHKAMKELCPTAEMLTDVDAKAQRELATSAAENLLTAHNDLYVFFGAQTEMGIGIAGVIDAKNLDAEKYYVSSEGWWDTEFFTYMVEKKIMKSMGVKPSVPLGEISLNLFNDYFTNGTPFPPVVGVDAVIVTTDNYQEHLDEWNKYIASEE
jgi:ABC-type sugar transport system substrate-binding protein